MINFDDLKQHIVNMNYGRNIGSLIILVPGLSFLVQKIQIQHILRSLEDAYQQDNRFNYLTSHEYSKINEIYKWHAIGSAIQVIAFGLLVNPCSPLFLIPCSLAAYQFYHAFTGFFGDRTVIEYGPNGLHIER